MDLEAYMWTCPSKKYLGIECFGCGAQRALVLLLEGEFAAAFQLFPAIYTLVVLFVVFIINIFSKKNYTRAILVMIAVNLAVIIISYFLR